LKLWQSADRKWNVGSDAAILVLGGVVPPALHRHIQIWGGGGANLCDDVSTRAVELVLLSPILLRPSLKSSSGVWRVRSGTILGLSSVFAPHEMHHTS